MKSWDTLEAEKVVRIRVVPDEEMFDDSYLDTWGLSPEELKKERADLWRQIEREGVWGFIGEWFDGTTWQHVDSCWGFVGDPDPTYVKHTKRMVLDAYGEHLEAQAQAQADALQARPTYAGNS